MRRRHVGGALALALALVASVPEGAEAQERGVQQRESRVTGQAERDAADVRQGRLLLDRFARRVGQALHLEPETTRRLLTELQRSRAERARIGGEARALRAELGRVIQEAPVDQGLVADLLDRLFELETARVEVAADEQRRLAEFLTPLQRARVLWLQQRLARQALQRDGDGPMP